MPSDQPFFDDLELLALMLRLHEDGRLHHQSGEQLFSELGGSVGVQEDRDAFTRMLQVAQEDELISFELTAPMGMPEPRRDEYAYLANLQRIQSRTKGSDRARGQRIVAPAPEPGEDDGRRIPRRVVEKAADAMGAELRAEEVRSFLLDADVPVEFSGPAGSLQPPGQVIRRVLFTLIERGSSGRRVARSVIGRWLDDELEVGPTVAMRAKLIGELARAGWKVKRSTLVIAPCSKPPRFRPASDAQPSGGVASPADGPLSAGVPTPESDPHQKRKVMVVYGRDADATRGLFDLLRAVGLQPQEWTQLIGETGTATPYTGQVLDRALAIVQAVVVLFTPDDLAVLDPALQAGDDQQPESRPAGQPRANVLYEAGLAFGRHPERTILVELGDLRGLSDLAGRHTVRLTNGPPAFQDLAQRLTNAGCETDLSGSDWLDPQRFKSRREG